MGQVISFKAPHEEVVMADELAVEFTKQQKRPINRSLALRQILQEAYKRIIQEASQG
jgi:hypothetical protein